ncbi:prenyltransferase/squalene oxidase repeat-containing protein [Pontiellaceae bacterium B12227]|nr:prenyltransferase/squalene oxidase repeat-containing protein [Pontiellaceae bacterium B12227]
MEIDRALAHAKECLLAELLPEGRWEGELSSSALATAVASFALKLGGKTELAHRGFQWLENDRNEDGGWGDSPESPSNFTATLLSRCALDMATGEPDKLVAEILHFYGADQTFSVPILTMCMLSGKLGDDWSTVPQLPFELAVFPHKFYRFLNLPVVSYALPALIAIGLVRHKQKPSPFGFYRNALVRKALKILEAIQPESGGFLEAAPLTGFVTMSLIGAGFREHPVTQNGLRFLEETMRDDGSWPIDVDLSSWLTSLSIRALEGDLSSDWKDRLRGHLLDMQGKEEHPFTHAEPGGWAWTHRTGGVPDADDTAAALIALHQLGCETAVAEKGVLWLLGLQNRDGGMPTFCRGWGKLPFDRSCPDLTAHAIRAFIRWRPKLDENYFAAVVDSIQVGVEYLEKEQRKDGSWVPLWFGSQVHPKNENPVYGTVRVLEALVELDEKEFPKVGNLKAGGFQWLENLPLENLCVEELALVAGMSGRGMKLLLEKTENGTVFPASPIGLYFASLWYAEKLYPMIFTVEALKRWQSHLTCP